MKIIQIGPFPENPDLIKGGVEASVLGLSYALSNDNDVFVLDLPKANMKVDRIETIDKIKIFRFSQKGKNNINAIKRIKSYLNIIKQIKPNICHIHSTSYFMLILVVLLKVSKYKFILTVHGLVHIEKSNVLKKNKSIINWLKFLSFSFSEFMLINLSKYIIVDTEYVKKEIVKYKRENKIIKLPKIEVIPQGIHVNYFNLITNPTDNLILSVGAFTPRKGHHLLLQSIKELSKLTTDYRVIMVGINSNNNYFNEIIRLIIELGLQDKVKILSDINLIEIKKIYTQAKIFALHSEEESQGIVFAEAMAVGLPIVATNVGGIPFVVHDKINGFLSNFGDTKQFAYNLFFLLGNTNLHTEMSQKNKIEARNYSWKTISESVIKIYNESLKC